MSGSSRVPENISILNWDMLLSQVRIKIKYQCERSSLQHFFRPCPHWIPSWLIFVRKGASYKKIRKAFRNDVGFMLFKNFKIPVQCPESRIKPSVPPRNHSARELLRAGATTIRHLAGIVWKGVKIGFPGCFQRWGLTEFLSAAFMQVKSEEGLSEYGSYRRDESEVWRCSGRFYLLVPPVCSLFWRAEHCWASRQRGFHGSVVTTEGRASESLKDLQAHNRRPRVQPWIAKPVPWKCRL